jgi:hypothetical protein
MSEKHKKRRTVEVIESTPRPEIEHHFYKEKGKEIVENTDYKKSTHMLSSHYEVPSEIKEYTDIHTHPAKVSVKSLFSANSFKDILTLLSIYKENPLKKYHETGSPAILSGDDFKKFLRSDREREKIIAVREPDTGKVRGYCVVGKTKKTPEVRGTDIFSLNMDFVNYNDVNNLKELRKNFDEIIKKYHLKYRFLPAKGYKLNDAGTQFVKIEDNNLEKKILTSVFGMFAVAGLFFGFSNVTGAVIGFSKSFFFPVGIILFILGILGLFFERRLK